MRQAFLLFGVFVLANAGEWDCVGGYTRANQNKHHFDPEKYQIPMWEDDNDEYVCDDETALINNQKRCCMPITSIWPDGEYVSHGELPMRIVDDERKLIVISHVLCDPYSDLHTLIANPGATLLGDGWTILVDEQFHTPDCYKDSECIKDVLKYNRGGDYASKYDNCYLHHYHYMHEYTVISEYQDLIIMPLGFYQSYIGWSADFPLPSNDVIIWNDDRHMIRIQRKGPLVPAKININKREFHLSAWSNTYLSDVEYECPRGKDKLCYSKQSSTGSPLGVTTTPNYIQGSTKQSSLMLVVRAGNAMAAQICTALDIQTTGNELVGIQFFLKGCWNRMEQTHPAFRVPIKFSGAEVMNNKVYLCVNGDGTALTMFVSADNIDGRTLKSDGVIINVQDVVLYNNYVGSTYWYPQIEPGFGSTDPTDKGYDDLGFGYHTFILDATGSIYAPQSIAYVKQGNAKFSIFAYGFDNFSSASIPGQEYLTATTEFNSASYDVLLGLSGMNILTGIFLCVIAALSVVVCIFIMIVCPIRLLIDSIKKFRKERRKKKSQ